MGKIRKNVNNEEKQKMLVSQDMKLVKALAGNEKKIRDRALRNLKEWFRQRSSKMSFTEDDYLRIWKGLFCTMWMSDKPLIQEECAENIANLIHFTTDDSALLFFKCGLTLMAIEWFGIDQWRIDKFFMLVRRMLRQAFVFLKQNEWDSKLVNEFARVLSQTVLNDSYKCLGLTMHVTEIYLEELAKVSNGSISSDLIVDLLKPFVRYMSMVNDDRQIKHTVKCMFYHLMQQSDVGLEHEARFAAWKQQGFPGGTINVMEKMDVDDDGSDDNTDNSDEQDLDPRAGRVDVVLPQLKFDTQSLLRLFNDFKFKKESTTIGKKALTRLQQQFDKLTKGSYPLGVTRVPLVKPDNVVSVDKSVDDLIDFQHQLRQDKKQLRKKQTEKPKRLNGVNKNIFADKLKEFVEKSEGNLQVRRKPRKKRKSAIVDDPNWSFEDSFRRNSGLWTVHRLNEESPAPATPNGLSPKADAWKQPLKTGETEIFVPSNKYKAKMKAQGKDVNEVVGRIMRSPNLVKNPFAITPLRKTPKSEKKVRIALKLNQSQEIHEHEAQLKSSPGIPYDASKRPDKPLLKPNFIKSPVNPFYKRKVK